jgi:tetratricopeptide (TPR) repeat protein
MNTTRHAITGAVLALVFCASGNASEPLYDGLGTYSRKITTKSAKAQRYFDQGLALLHGFNHRGAIRSFQEAARLDPQCAMAHWGAALAAGPHINYPLVPPPMAELAWKELTLAKQNASNASEVERALIDGLSKRYAYPQPEDRAPLDQAYADAMREVWKKFPKDVDVGALFAEAMMDLRPWNQWTLEGQPNPGTEEIIATLDAVLKLNPRHPFANHLYIHAVEASPHPERADAAADRLRKLQPGLAHNVHMPSHIDIRRGRWHEAIATNAKAVQADKRYRAATGNRPLGLFPMYAAHNQHMLAYAALMTGQSKLAMRYVREMIKDLPAEFVRENAALVEAFGAVPMEVMMRFGKWDDILAEPENYPDYMPFARAFHHGARAIAFAAKSDTENARKEQAIFRELVQRVPKETAVSNNTAESITAVANHMIEGELLIAEGKLDLGLEELRAALTLEDALKYDEPPSWMIPLRHTIGANLMHAGRFAEAEQVYRDDLKRLPENGWSLFGLSQALAAQEKDGAELEAIRARFNKVWTKADVKITSSCLCRPASAEKCKLNGSQTSRLLSATKLPSSPASELKLHQ